MRLIGGCATDTGNIRRVNQDAVFFRCQEKKGQYFAVGAVCDGIGGLQHGEIASGKVIQAIADWYEKITEWIDVEEIAAEVLFSHLKDAVEDCNRMVREMIDDYDCQMGTTLSVLMMIRERYYIIHVGDSRIYLYHERLQQLTSDAVVSRMRNGEMKQYLANYIGKADELWFTTVEGIISPGDMFLYGSDGLCHLMLEEDISKLYRSRMMRKRPDGACRQLIETILQRGEKDNVSVGIMLWDREKGLFKKEKQRQGGYGG